MLQKGPDFSRAVTEGFRLDQGGIEQTGEVSGIGGLEKRMDFIWS